MKKTDNGQGAVREKSEGPEVAIHLGEEPQSRAPSSVLEVPHLDVTQCGSISLSTHINGVLRGGHVKTRKITFSSRENCSCQMDRRSHLQMSQDDFRDFSQLCYFEALYPSWGPVVQLCGEVFRVLLRSMFL